MGLALNRPHIKIISKLQIFAAYLVGLISVKNTIQKSIKSFS
jgi:hypothetical protein